MWAISRMMGNNKGEIAAFRRVMVTLEALLNRSDENDAERSAPSHARRGDVSATARALGIPVSTAHRQVATLIAAGLLRPSGSGRHVAGPRLRRLATMADPRHILTSAAIGPLDRLAARTRAIAQLGSLDDAMVTYHLKTGHGAAELFTRIGMQLEAYCSGIGKILLAHLPEEQQAAYLEGGPFPPLTPRTITDPVQLAQELARVRACDYAVDDEEISVGLRCMAVPLRDEAGRVVAAISLSAAPDNRSIALLGEEGLAMLLRGTASVIEEAAFGVGRPTDTA